MDAERFDTLARTLTHGHSRRSLTRLLGGLSLGGPLALLGLAEVEAKRKKKKRKKKKPVAISPPPLSATCVEGQRPCNGACIPSNQCCIDSECGEIAPRCCRGTCLRPGECCLDNECSPDKVCRTGECVCPSGQEEIGGVCGTRPECEGPFGSCTCPDPLDRCTNTVCCGDFCRQNPTTSVFFCTHSSEGKRCRSTEDCSSGLTCRGFVCTA
jgi:hypothetical protein